MTAPVPTLSPTMGSLQPSVTLGLAAKAKALQKAGQDVVNMTAGEPDFDTPRHIKDAAVKALMAGDTKYTPVAGRPELREAAAAKFRRDNGIDAAADRVVVAPGAKFSVFTAVAALCSAGDEVLIPAPFWLSYLDIVKASGATAVLVPTDAADEFALRRDVLERHITRATKLLILNSPCNPTGAVCPLSTLEMVAELAQRHNFMVLSDEIYEKLVFDPEYRHVSIASLSADMQARTVTVNGFSKSYAMTGWRLGYLTGPGWLVKSIDALQSHTASNPTSFAQAGALAALTGPQEPVEQMRQAFAARRDRIYVGLAAIPRLKVTKPRGAFYILPDVSAFGLGSMAFAERLLERKLVAVVPGLPFGGDAYVRLSFACDMPTIEKACARFAEFCAGL